MTGTLAFVGGEPFSEGCSFNQRLADDAGATEVVLLATAAAFEHPQRWVEAAARHFSGFGVAVHPLDVLNRADAMDEAKAEVVRQGRMIYLVGPSALHARPTLQQTTVWESLVEAHHQGATGVGSDGGAQVLGDPMMDDRGGAFTVGLGLIHGVAVVPRYETRSDDALHRIKELSAPDLAVIGIDTSTAAIRNPEGHWTAEGLGHVHATVGAEPVDLADLSR